MDNREYTLPTVNMHLTMRMHSYMTVVKVQRIVSRTAPREPHNQWTTGNDTTKQQKRKKKYDSSASGKSILPTQQRHTSIECDENLNSCLTVTFFLWSVTLDLFPSFVVSRSSAEKKTKNLLTVLSWSILGVGMAENKTIPPIVRLGNRIGTQLQAV